MGRKCGTCWEEKKYIQVYVGKSEGKKLCGKPGCRWEDVNWICLV